MGQVDILYWKQAAICLVVGIAFFFFTTETLLRGKFRLPSWVFSLFTLTIGVFFFKIAVDSVAEFTVGRHDSLDQLRATWNTVINVADFFS